MNISDLQFAFFFANPPVNLKFDEFSVDLRKKTIFTENDFDLQTFIFPIPNDVPAEFPRCQITSSDKNFNLQVSGERCDIRFNCKSEESLTLFRNIVTEVIKIFSKEDVKIVRFGYVKRYIVKNRNPDHIIREKFLKLEKDDLKEPLIRFLFKVQVNESIYNDLYQIETAVNKNFLLGTSENVIVITHDFNTLPEDTKYLNDEDLNTFLKNVPVENIKNYVDMLSE